MTDKKYYPEVDSNPDFPKQEENILQYWQKNNIFEKSVENRSSDNEFVFYDGPPFANGLPHYGHLLTGYVKDIFARYQTLKGKRTERRFGWDCHGLPAEMGAEKELNISGRHKIMEFGIDNFNNHCRTSVMKYSSEWKKYVSRQARWVDFDGGYKTMDTGYIESVLWAFKQLYDKGLVYESMRVMPYSWACETPLSNFETRMDNAYREKASKAATVAFTLKSKPEGAPVADEYKILAWTTTPWTLPSNLALAVGNDIKYTCVVKDNTCYILAESSVAKYEKELENSRVETTFTGANLVGLEYEPLFPYFSDNKNSFKILAADFVAEGDGTGIVHLAPGFGEDDFDACKKADIPLVCPVDNGGRFTEEVFDLALPNSLSPTGECAELPLPVGEGWGEGQKSDHYNKKLKDFARNLRKDSTDVENTLWQLLRNRQILDCKFYRQRAIGDYIADFACRDLKVIIELDGGQHAEKRTKEYDNKRTEFLEGEGYTVLRFWNSDVAGNLEGVMETIYNTLFEHKQALTLTLSHRERELPSHQSEEPHLPVGEGWGEGSFSKLYSTKLTKKPEGAPDADEYILISILYKHYHYKNSLFRTNNKYLCLKVDEKNNQLNLPSSKCFLLPLVGHNHDVPILDILLEYLRISNYCTMYNDVKAPLNIGDIFNVDFGDSDAKKTKFFATIISNSFLKENGIETIFSIPDGKRNVLECNDEVIKYLKSTNAWLKTEQYLHNYPHCWRTDTPLIYKAVPSWYVEVTKFKDRMVELNQKINWIPNHVRDGLFGKWLENARDWSISRNRFWGAPIPVWKSTNPRNDKLYVFGSIKELEEFFKVKVEDLHRPFIDTLTCPDPDDNNYQLKRVEDVFDCWFESGSMPYAQAHYPFENKEWFESHFSADFIVEYTAQTRGWFYTLMVLHTALHYDAPYNKAKLPPFKNVICHGVVLDEKGQKLSKRLNNYADPIEIFEKFGSDAMRWVMVSSPILHGGELLIDKEGNMVRDAVRLVLKPVWNAYNFLCLYANADGLQGKLIEKSINVMDRYILSKCKDAVAAIEQFMDGYDTPSACKVIEDFFEVLNNWYIRRSKERFWKSEKDEDKQSAYDTLHTVLHIMVRAASPLLPMLCEEIWLGLNGESSVHLQNYPDLSNIKNEPELVRNMDRVRDVCNAALSVRSAENIRVRQPLAGLKIVMANAVTLTDYADVIKDEINVKEVKLADNVEEYASYNLKINFPILGKRLPEKMKQIIPLSKQGKWEKTPDDLIKICDEILQKDEFTLTLDPKDKKGAQSLSSNDALVILDLNITEDLRIEGIARDLVRLIQQSRKDANLNITDRIKLNIEANNDNIKSALNNFGDYIAEQTLAVSVVSGSAKSCSNKFAHKLDGEDVNIGFEVT